MTGDQAIKALPRTIRIAGLNFKIEKWARDSAESAGRYGECAMMLLTLRIGGNNKSGARVFDTLHHEINHAVWSLYNIKEGDNEERMIGTLASAWTQIFCDNPWLAKWIGKALA